MNTRLYKSSKWLDTQAKTLEKKILKTKGRGPSFSTISRLLSEQAIIELRDCNDSGCIIVLNEEQYKINKQNIINEYIKVASPTKQA